MLQYVLVILSVIGLVDSSYLLYKRKRKQPLSCPLNQKCDAVTESKYGKTLGIKNDIIGIIYYSCVLLAAFMLVAEYKIHMVRTLLLGASFLATVMSGRLMALMIWVIRNYCTYCMISAITNSLIFLTAVFIYLGW